MPILAGMNRSVVFLLGALLLIVGCAAPATPSATPSPTAPPATATPGPMPFWRPATVPGSEVGSSSLQVVPAGDGLVAIGYDGRLGSILWTSADGAAWTNITPDGFDAMGIVSVVPFEGGLLGVGRGDTTDVDSEVAAVWISEDGISWRRAEGGPDMRGQMIDVVATDAGLFAVGGVPGEDAAGIWRSTDGETWERTGGDFPRAFIWSIAEGGPGLVATGWRRNPEPDLAVWTSADGLEWTLAPDPEGFEGFEGLDVIEHKGTLVIVGGSIERQEARFWTSSDGAAWQAADPSGLLAGATARKLVATGSGLVALGAYATDGAAWISADGHRWEPIGDLVPNAFFNAAFVEGDTLVVSGATQEGTIETGIDVFAMIWTTSLGGS